MAQNIRYLNQSAPFWDWISDFEESAGKHPFFNSPANQPEPDNSENHEHGHGGYGSRRNWSHGRRGGFGGPSHHRGPTAPANQDDATLPDFDEKHADGPQQPDQEHTPQQESSSPSPNEHPGHRHGGRHGAHHGGPYRGGGCRGRRGFGHGFGHGFPHGRGPFPFGGFGGFGQQHKAPPGNWAEFCGLGQGSLNDLGKLFSQQFGVNDEGDAKTKDKDFAPPCDVFDTPDAYVLHISLPGAKKEDVGVNWNADKSELNVAGVIYRPGNEEMLKTLAMDERDVGPFERKVRLGSRANPALVNADAISAKMEDGVLIVTVPKTEDFVEIKRVDIE